MSTKRTKGDKIEPCGTRLVIGWLGTVAMEYGEMCVKLRRDENMTPSNSELYV